MHQDRREIEESPAIMPKNQPAISIPEPEPSQHDAKLATRVMLDGQDPFCLFGEWFANAVEKEPNDPNAMVFSSCDGQGYPNARIVLLKAVEDGEFVFYTNLGSQKSCEIGANPQGALCFHWKSLHSQIRVRGAIRRIANAKADAYFRTRPRESQIGAWASRQSQLLADMDVLRKEIIHYEERFGKTNPSRPDFWSGFCLAPQYFEFWRHGAFRLHQRLVFSLARPEGSAKRAGKWYKYYLFP